MVPRWVVKLWAETGMNQPVHEIDRSIVENDSGLESSVRTQEAVSLASPGYAERQEPKRTY